MAVHPLPRLHALPATLPLEGSVRIELQEGVPVFRASGSVQPRIKDLLFKGREEDLTIEEEEELDRYEEIDDYLSFINRVTRNLIQSQSGKGI
ncbi:MAG: hypothetical protein U9R15_15800 [Chloroflexota bacterium]|nr:hypothetical protein [Chloroflexota bacterium]